MDFNKARTFVEVIDSGSFSAAARRLKRTQQAVSLQIKALEQELNILLLIRDGSKILLTEGGECLYNEFKIHFAAIENSVYQFNAGKSRASGMIRMGGWLEMGELYFPDMICTFSKKYPLVEFEIFAGVDDELEEMVLNNIIDFSLQVHVGNERILQKIPIARLDVIPVVSQRYLQDHEMPKSIRETLDMPLIDFSGEYSVYRQWIRKNALKLLPEAEKKRIFVQVLTNMSLKQLVLRGLGFGFISRQLIRKELDDGELLALALPKKVEPIRVIIDTVHKRENNLGFIQREFIQHLRDHLDRDIFS